MCSCFMLLFQWLLNIYIKHHFIGLGQICCIEVPGTRERTSLVLVPEFMRPVKVLGVTLTDNRAAIRIAIIKRNFRQQYESTSADNFPLRGLLDKPHLN